MPTHTWVVTDRAGASSSRSVTYAVGSSGSSQKVCGMSAPAPVWSTRLADVGPSGVMARRIFGNFTSTGRDQADLIEAAVAAGMMPIVSYKGTPTTANVAAVRSYLNSLGVPVTATWHHEPHGDMTPAEFRAGSQVFLAAKSPTIKVGPILNGWLLDNRLNDFASYTDSSLLAAWDFIGMDTYQSDATSTRIPGDRIAPLLSFLSGAGQASKPILIGEYNGFTADAIARSGEVFLSTPTLWVFCMWNSGPTGLGTPLEGSRLSAFKATKADSRVKR